MFKQIGIGETGRVNGTKVVCVKSDQDAIHTEGCLDCALVGALPLH